MEKQKLMLTKDEIPIGAVVYKYSAGNESPELMPNRKPKIFHKRVWGNPAIIRLCHIVNGEVVSTLENIAKEERFSPVETYSPENTHIGGVYVIYVDGKPIMYDNLPSRLPIEVEKIEEHGYVGFIDMIFGNEIYLHPDAELICVNDTKKY